MNERMIELYQEASEFAYKICREEGREGGTGDHIWNTLSTGRFAELIVEECVKEIEFQYGGGSDQPMDNEWDRAIECASSMVKYRFGVKE